MTQPLPYDQVELATATATLAATQAAAIEDIRSDRQALLTTAKSALALTCEIVNDSDNASVVMEAFKCRVTFTAEVAGAPNANGVYEIANANHVGLLIETQQPDGSWVEVAGDYAGFKKEAGTPPGGAGADLTFDFATSLVTRTDGALGTETAPLSELRSYYYSVLGAQKNKDARTMSKTSLEGAL